MNLGVIMVVSYQVYWSEDGLGMLWARSVYVDALLLFLKHYHWDLLQ